MPRLLKQSTAFTFRIGPFVDSTDGFTAETALSIAQADMQISKNGDAFAQTSASSPTTTHGINGWYQCPLTATDTNTLGHLTIQIVKSGALPVWEHFTVVSAVVWDSWIGGTDLLQVDLQQILGSAATGDAYARLGAPVNASISADIAAVKGDTQPQRRNTAQAGTATTITLDASASATDNIYNGQWISLSVGTGVGQTRLITGYVGSTKVATVANAWTTNPASGTTFIIRGAAWVPGVNALGASAVTATAIATGAITNAKFAAGAIDATAIAGDAIQAGKIATDAITATKIAAGAITNAKFAAGAIDAAAIAASAIADTKIATGAITAAKFAAGAIDAAAVAADAIGASELATDAVNEIRDAILADSTPFNGASVATILTSTNAIGAAGAGLTAVPWNASWDAEVQSEVEDALDVQLADSIPADGTIPTLRQAIYMVNQFLLERGVSGTTVTVRKVDGSTALLTLTLDDGTTPTSITRAT